MIAAMGNTLPASAYTITQTSTGVPIRWHYGQKYFLAGNPANQSGVSTTGLWTAVVNGLQQWKRATKGMFDFDYWQGTDPLIFWPRQEQDGQNTIFFASQTSRQTDPNVIGFTQVWFNANSGDLIEADIILNDRDYQLTETPTDTSSKKDGSKRVYLNNVITHELGHAIGLSHSNSINSTMLYVEFSEQFKLGCDDWSAAQHLYPTYNNGMGTLSGVILSPAGDPIPGAVVTAISQSRGVPMASVLTDQTGKFNFGALENGSYGLMVESYQGTPGSIPAQMRTKTEIQVCEKNHFPKNFVTEKDRHSLRKFNVVSGRNTIAGPINLTCETIKPADTDYISDPTDLVVDQAESGTSKVYSFEARGPFRINALSYLILSPLKISLTQVDESGNPIPETRSDSLYRSRVSDYKIEDGMISGIAHGKVHIKVDISETDGSEFPTPAVQPSKTNEFVLVFNHRPRAALSSIIPNNARCDSMEPLPEYQSPPGMPVRFSSMTSSRDSIGFCGNAHAASFYEGKRTVYRDSTPIGTILGWALPFLVAIACQLFLRKRRAKL